MKDWVMNHDRIEFSVGFEPVIVTETKTGDKPYLVFAKYVKSV